MSTDLLARVGARFCKTCGAKIDKAARSWKDFNNKGCVIEKFEPFSSVLFHLLLKQK